MDNPEAKIVAGVDGSDSSVQALRLAARLAPALNARIHTVACWEFPQMYAGYAPPDFEAFQDQGPGHDQGVAPGPVMA